MTIFCVVQGKIIMKSSDNFEQMVEYAREISPGGKCSIQATHSGAIWCEVATINKAGNMSKTEFAEFYI